MKSNQNLHSFSGWLCTGLLAAGLLCITVRPAGAADMVEAWGFGGQGQLGNGTTTNSSAPVVVNGLSNVITIASGDSHNLAVQNGGAFAWGYNLDGELGNGATTNSSVPVAVTGLSNGVTAVSAGLYSSIAVQNGGVYGWGRTTNSLVPVVVSGLSSGVAAIAAGTLHSLAVQNSGVYAWGSNSNGELGNGTTTNSSAPVAVIGLSDGVTAIAAGDDYSLAVRNGGVYAWGYNAYGQLGNNSTVDSSQPVPVSGLSSGVTAIAAGITYGLALKNGGVYAWGYNVFGQLGDGTQTNRLTPERVDPADLTNIIAVAANFDGDSSHALSADGSIWDWGWNANGALGLDTNVGEYLTPQHLLPPTGYAFTAISANFTGAVTILSPVSALPEPASLPLLALGLLALRRSRTALRLHGESGNRIEITATRLASGYRLV